MAETRLNDHQVNTAGRIGYFLVSLQGAFSICIPTFLIIFGTNVLGIKIALISLMMALVKIFDGITDLIAGVLIDKTNTKAGKARPWFLWMCLPYGLVYAAEFWIPPTWSPTLKLVLLIVFYTLTVSVFGTIVGIATGAILPRMTTSNKERGILGAFCGGGSVTLCGFLMAFVFPLQAKLGFSGTFTLFGGIVFVLTLCGYLFIRELPNDLLAAGSKNWDKPVKFKDMVWTLAHNKYALLRFVDVMLVQIAGSFIMSCGTYYAIYVLGSQNWYTKFMLCGSFGSLAGMFVSAFLVTKIGSKGVYTVGCLLAVIGFAIIRISGDNPIVVVVCFFFILMGGQVFTNGQNGVLGAQSIEYGEWKNGIRSDGVIACTGNVGNKIGAALGTALIGFLLGAAGFAEGGVEQSAQAIQGIKMTYTVGCPIAYLILAVFFAATWGLEKMMPQISKELAERRAANLKEMHK